MWLDLGWITHARILAEISSENLLPIQAEFVTERDILLSSTVTDSEFLSDAPLENLVILHFACALARKAWPRSPACSTVAGYYAFGRSAAWFPCNLPPASFILNVFIERFAIKITE